MTLSAIFSDSFVDFYQQFHNYLGQSQKHGSFIYRGEASAMYELYPGALRVSGIKKLKRLAGSSERQKSNSDTSLSARLEMLAVRNFYRHANTRGLWVPYLEEFGQYSMTDEDIFGKIWEKGIISPKYYELFALAQHYFVPTRFLDWSFDIHVALWFAASSAYEHSKKKSKDDCEAKGTHSQEDKFSLWVMNYGKVKNLKIDYPTLPGDADVKKCIKNSIDTKGRDTIQFIVPPYASNPNLRAQRGILSYVPIGVDTIKPKCGDYFGDSLDKSIKMALEKNGWEDSDRANYIRKFTFSCKEAREVLSFLSTRGYDKASIYPGYQHIAESMELESELGNP